MFRLGIAFRRWIAYKMETDPFWKSVGPFALLIDSLVITHSNTPYHRYSHTLSHTTNLVMHNRERKWYSQVLMSQERGSTR